MELTKCIHDYFSGEKKFSIFLLGFSILTILVSYVIYMYEDYPAGFGFASSLAFFSGIHILVSVIRYGMAYVKERKIQSLSKDAPELKHEWKRMERVASSFPKVRMVQEIIFGLALLGIILGLAKWIGPISLGFSMGVFFQVAVLIVFDLFSQRRAEEYERRLRLILEGKREP